MSSGPQSDALARALSAGAPIGLARAILSTRDPEAVANYIDARLSDLTANELQYVRDLADQAISAAAVFSLSGPGDIPDTEAVPIIPDLFGQDWGGKRLFWVGQWNIPGTKEWYDFSGDLPDIEGIFGIRQQAANQASGYIEAYPGRFPGAEENSTDTINIRILALARGF